MAKRIIFCADGTGENPTADTNVYRFFKALTISSSQVSIYDDGLGVEGLPLERLNALAFGFGITKKIKDLYGKIAHLWEPGDELHGCGFSRGAFIVRALADMICAVGLPTDPFPPALIDNAFDAYRDPSKRESLNALYGMTLPTINGLFVFDTVGALGPWAAIGKVDPTFYGYLDVTIHERILNAFQALAIDEKRVEFTPTPWLSKIPRLPGQTLEQKYFVGVHSDVGGGYGSPALSDIPLAWMASKAASLGLVFSSGFATPEAKLALAEKHESWNCFWGFPKKRIIPADATLSYSVVLRCENDPSYRPENLNFDNFGNLSTDYTIDDDVLPP